MMRVQLTDIVEDYVKGRGKATQWASEFETIPKKYEVQITLPLASVTASVKEQTEVEYWPVRYK